MPSSRDRIESALKNLKKEHFRITEPRKALLQLLVQADTPLSAEEAHRRLAGLARDAWLEAGTSLWGALTRD